ncbi:Protein kinase domain [Macleaya cordata]|uniref:Protein kinase domain n=1 Tax=Macleaya cordata TaxID=56857 RepID=A0A200PUP8_MACCD|nr:Protein kinase domain [Macleaya cordata]
MLSRAFKDKKIRRAKKYGEGSSKSSLSHNEEDEDCIVGLTGDLPLNFCEYGGGSANTGNLCLREVLKSSVHVLGESGLGITEKVVLRDEVVYTAKRFRKVTISKKEFGRRIERLAYVSGGCKYLVQVRAYLYAKRIKVVLCDYSPMGSLADLLNGARELGHTPLDWDQRLAIIIDVATAITFIHRRFPLNEKNLQINVHGNIKASNVIIKTNFSACLSDYGFVQLAEQVQVPGVLQQKQPETMEEDVDAVVPVSEKLSQKNDIYSFGAMVLDMLGGPKAPFQISYILEKKEEIKEGKVEFFEFFVEGNKRKQALQVLDTALACINPPDARPSIDQILLFLGEVTT